MYFQFFNLDNNFHAFMKVEILLTERFTDIMMETSIFTFYAERAFQE